MKKLKLEWRNVTVTREIKSGPPFKKQITMKDILSDVSGEANPGELLSIMGPSGGGKTSLLNCLSRRIKLTSGTVLLNGNKVPRFVCFFLFFIWLVES